MLGKGNAKLGNVKRAPLKLWKLNVKPAYLTHGSWNVKPGFAGHVAVAKENVRQRRTAGFSTVCESFCLSGEFASVCLRSGVADELCPINLCVELCPWMFELCLFV